MQQPDYAGIEDVLEISRKVYLETLSDSQESEFIRSIDEAKVILHSLRDIQVNLMSLFKETPSLESLFEKEFGSFNEFLARDRILDICFLDDYFFPEDEIFPIVVYDQFDPKLAPSYVEVFRDWGENKLQDHNDCQKQIIENFDEKLNYKSLLCQCQKCVGDYRGKLRDHVFKFCRDKIDEAEDWVVDHVDGGSIDDVSHYFTHTLRKEIEKKIHLVRYRLKKSSLNKLDKQVKSILEDRFSSKSELGRKYLERVKKFCFECLDETDIQQDLISDREFQRFYDQLGINIWKNEKFIRREFNKLAKSLMVLKRKDISATILRDYLGQFWVHSKARRLKRKIVYHMGPTNSGKTYHAIERLSKARNGCYLAPLRLLASELYDTLSHKGVSTTLLTGEEVIETENATHFSSTIEMAKFNEEFEVCVIDEIQMVKDSQRGWAWTRAFVNIIADEIHLCGDDSVLELIEEMVELTGDVLEIKRYERLTKLEVARHTVKAGDLEKGDAVIVFSRKKALKYKSDLERMDFKVSIVYGRLSPEVRREQARKFDQGETDVIVSTDAISMGMNLPIKRIVFTTLSKYINSKEIPITDSEIKQIAGRAGRYGRYPVGFVTCLARVEDGLHRIGYAISSDLEQSKMAMVGPDLEIFSRVNDALVENNLATLKLSEFLRLFNTMTFKDPFYCVDLHEMIEIAEMVEEANSEKLSLSNSEIFGFTCAPVNLGLMEHVQYFVWIVNRFVNGLPIRCELVDSRSDSIDYLETSIKCVELYQWLARHFQNKHFDFEENEILGNKSDAIEKLNDLLSEKLVRNCSSCGTKLGDNHEFNICETCFRSRRFTRGKKQFSSDKKNDNRRRSKGSSKDQRGRKKGFKGPKKRSKKKR